MNQLKPLEHLKSSNTIDYSVIKKQIIQYKIGKIQDKINIAEILEKTWCYLDEEILNKDKRINKDSCNVNNSLNTEKEILINIINIFLDLILDKLERIISFSSKLWSRWWSILREFSEIKNYKKIKEEINEYNLDELINIYNKLKNILNIK